MCERVDDGLAVRRALQMGAKHNVGVMLRPEEAAAVSQRIEALEQMVGRLAARIDEENDWHEWNCRSSWVNGAPCDCEGGKLKIEALALVAGKDGEK